MPQQYTNEQLWELYGKSPQELKEAVFSEKTADNVYSICEKNNIDDVSKLMEYVQNVLIGILPPFEFEEVIEKELKLKRETAKNVARDIYRFVFHPVKESLEKTYEIELAPLAKMKVTPPPQEKPPEPPKDGDAYRESVE